MSAVRSRHCGPSPARSCRNSRTEPRTGRQLEHQKAGRAVGTFGIRLGDRTTMLSVKPIQKLRSPASIRRVVGLASTIVQFIFCAVASAIGNALLLLLLLLLLSGASAREDGG